jgi:EAL domain-containing protein (putative c-di-GMP-specific phosphodiesterase class I)
MRSKAKSRGDLRHALERREFVLHYQPKVNLQTRNYGSRGANPLAHPNRRLIRPSRFISIGGDGFDCAISKWVLRGVP